MEDLSLFDQYPLIQLISYILTVIVGGVGYKFYRQFSENQQVNQKHQKDAAQVLVENLQNRVDKLTIDLEKHEQESKEVHKRELQRTKDLAETRAEVRILIERVKYLEEKLERERKINKKYREKYGSLDSIHE